MRLPHDHQFHDQDGWAVYRNGLKRIIGAEGVLGEFEVAAARQLIQWRHIVVQVELAGDLVVEVARCGCASLILESFRGGSMSCVWDRRDILTLLNCEGEPMKRLALALLIESGRSRWSITLIDGRIIPSPLRAA
jgi:hypothetical protein